MPMSLFKLILTTTGGFDEPDMLAAKLDELLVARHPDVEIVIGFSLAGDAIGRQYAADRGYQVKEFTAAYMRMAEVIQYADAAAVAWDGQSPGTKRLIDEVRSAGKRCKVVIYQVPAKAVPKPAAIPRNAVVIDGEVLTPEVKKRRKPASSGQKDFRYMYKDVYEEAHKQWFQRKYPHAWKDGHYTSSRCPDVTTANGMASYIVDHCEWTGNYANRINVMGRQIKGKHVTSSTKKGTPDVDILIKAVPIKAEIKIGKDALSDAQIKQHAAITKAGGNYFVFKSIDDYLDVFYRFSVKQSDMFST